MATERHAALHEITYDQFLSFTNKFTENLYIKCLAEGNLSKEFVLKTVADVVKPLQYSRIPPEIYPHRMVWEIPVGRTFCQVKNLNPTDDNCTITHYYQCGYYTVKLKMMVELLMVSDEKNKFDIKFHYDKIFIFLQPSGHYERASVQSAENN